MEDEEDEAEDDKTEEEAGQLPTEPPDHAKGKGDGKSKNKGRGKSKVPTVPVKAQPTSSSAVDEATMKAIKAAWLLIDNRKVIPLPRVLQHENRQELICKEWILRALSRTSRRLCSTTRGTLVA